MKKIDVKSESELIKKRYCKEFIFFLHCVFIGCVDVKNEKEDTGNLWFIFFHHHHNWSEGLILIAIDSEASWFGPPLPALSVDDSCHSATNFLIHSATILNSNDAMFKWHNPSSLPPEYEHEKWYTIMKHSFLIAFNQWKRLVPV